MKFSLPVSTLLSAFFVAQYISASVVPATFDAKLPNAEDIIPENDSQLLLPRASPSIEEAKNDKYNDYIIIFDENTSHQKRSLHQQWLVNDLLKKRDFNSDNSEITEEYDVAAIVDDGQNFAKRDDSEEYDYIQLFEEDKKKKMKKRRNIPAGIKGFFNQDKASDKHSINGYYGTFSDEEVEQIKSSGDVKIVERESYDQIQSNFVYVQYNTTWGLGRISHKTFDSPLGTDDSTYVFGSQGGRDTTLYILDSGVREDHIEFTGRVRWGANYIDDKNNDAHGHGTHITGIAAGHNVGVAKFANIVAVKVIDSQRRAAISNIIKGVQWIIEDHKKHPNQKSIINYSAVGSISEARTHALQQAVDAGIMVVTAAGNAAADACQYGPANMAATSDGVISVAALNYTNTPAYFTNYGPCATVYAPGVSILSAANDTTSAYQYMSGTSMSSPFVAGLAAYFWSLNPQYTLSQVKDLIVNYNQGQVKNNLPNTANKIAYNHL